MTLLFTRHKISNERFSLGFALWLSNPKFIFSKNLFLNFVSCLDKVIFENILNFDDTSKVALSLRCKVLLLSLSFYMVKFHDFLG